MKKERTETNHGTDLRREAEVRLKDCKDNPVGFAVEDSGDALALVHELQVHQIELEMQNEELKRTKLEADDALAKYSDLYDFAPIGLFNLNEQGIILEVNLAGAMLLGVERRNLTNRSFSKFVALKDRASFDDFRKKTFETSVKQTCELSLLRDGVPTIYARIVGTATTNSPPGERECRIAIVDITESKNAESILSRYQLISKHARDIVLHMGRDGSIIEANEAAINAYGYTRDELLSKSIFDLRAPESSDSTSMQMQLADAGGLLFETHHMRKDGSTFPVEVSSRGTEIEGKRVLLSIIRDISERKKAEQVLQQSERRFRNLFMSMDEGFALCEMIYDDEGKPADFRYLNVNPAFARLTGLPVARVVGRTVSEVIPSIEPFWIEACGRVVQSGHSKRIDHCLAALGRHFEAYVWRSDAGQFAVVFNEISERLQMEKELCEARNYLEKLINYANAPIIVWDTSFEITRFNRAFERLTGYEAANVLGKPLEILFPECSREESLGYIRHTLSGEHWEGVEIPIRLTDGSVRTVLWNSANILDLDENTVVATIAQGQDITGRKRAEEELRQAKDDLELKVRERTADLEMINKALQKSEAQYRRLAELSPDAVCVLKNDKILFANDALVELLGGSNRDEFVGQSILHFIHEDHRELARDRINRILKTKGTNATVEYKLIRMDGRIVETEVVSTPILYESCPAILSLGRDVTARKQAEAELRAAKEAAEAADLAKSNFMANMSHEIRTPMNAVIGMTSLLLDDNNLTLEHRDFIEIIRTSGDALMVIINDILDFTKMDRERTVLEEQPFDLRTCIEEAVGMVAVQANEKRLNLAYVIDENVPETILGDPARLRQVLVNLLNNACKFTIAGEVKLCVSDTAFCKIHEIHFAIQDTGIGISPDDIEKLFKPFSQVETSATRNYGGTGLGLAISKKLVELMGGRIWVKSAIGKGSTFHFTINAPASPKDAKPFLNIIQPKLVGKHVLIVDDNKINRHALGLQIYSWGMVPLIASSGRDALSWIQRGDDFDLVILDGSIANDDVLLLAKEMQKIKRALPLVLLTSLGRHEASNIFTAVLTKPIKPAQLYAVLLELFAKKSGGESSQEHDSDGGASVPLPSILLAEDNSSNQKVIMAMLKRLGYRADPVANGIEALQALDRQHYDIVLMDVRMPEIGGLEATKIIRQRWPENGPKVIAITAHALEGDMKKCLDSGMDDYISKPVTMRDLGEVLNKYWPASKDQHI